MNQITIPNIESLDQAFYGIKQFIMESKQNVYHMVNTEMLRLYWRIGKEIVRIQQGDKRANYGNAVIQTLSEKLIVEFGKGFSKRNLERMRKFYVSFPIATTVSSQLSWSHYLELIKTVEEEKKRWISQE